MNVVFDFGGVLFRWQPHEFMARLLPQRALDGASAGALVADFFQDFGGDWGEFDRGTLDSDPLAQRIAARTGLDLHEARHVIAAVPSELQPVPQTVALLERLRQRGHRLFFLSNMPAPYADHLEATYPFVATFEAGMFSSRVRLIKPEPAIFHEAARRFGIQPAQSLFIDDHRANIDAAHTLGWRTLHFRDPAQCEAELLEQGLI